MNNFIYYTPTKVFFGKGEEENVGKIIKSYGIKKVLLHYGSGSIKANGIYDRVVSKLNEEKISFVELSGVSPNPKLSLVKKGNWASKRIWGRINPCGRWRICYRFS